MSWRRPARQHRGGERQHHCGAHPARVQVLLWISAPTASDTVHNAIQVAVANIFTSAAWCESARPCIGRRLEELGSAEQAGQRFLSTTVAPEGSGREANLLAATSRSVVWVNGCIWSATAERQSGEVQEAHPDLLCCAAGETAMAPCTTTWSSPSGARHCSGTMCPSTQPGRLGYHAAILLHKAFCGGVQCLFW